MRRIFIFLAIGAAFVVAALSFAVTSTSTAHPARVGYPNFVCVSTPSFGICIGPPTKRG